MAGTEWCLAAFLLPSFENAFRPFNKVTNDSSQRDEEIQNPEAPEQFAVNCNEAAFADDGPDEAKERHDPEYEPDSTDKAPNDLTSRVKIERDVLTIEVGLDGRFVLQELSKSEEGETSQSQPPESHRE